MKRTSPTQPPSRRGCPNRTAGPILAAIAQGGLKPSFRAAVTAASTYRGTLAVVVRSSATGAADRVDLWDLTNERVRAALPFPAEATLLSLAEGFAWVRDGDNRIGRWPLAELSPLEEYQCPDQEPRPADTQSRSRDGPRPRTAE